MVTSSRRTSELIESRVPVSSLGHPVSSRGSRIEQPLPRHMEEDVAPFAAHRYASHARARSDGRPYGDYGNADAVDDDVYAQSATDDDDE